jgi:hypothetical protein
MFAAVLQTVQLLEHGWHTLLASAYSPVPHDNTQDEERRLSGAAQLRQFVASFTQVAQLESHGVQRRVISYPYCPGAQVPH